MIERRKAPAMQRILNLEFKRRVVQELLSDQRGSVLPRSIVNTTGLDGRII